MKLESFDLEYFQNLLKRSQIAALELEAFGKYLQAKLDLPEGSQIAPDGEIIMPTETA